MTTPSASSRLGNSMAIFGLRLQQDSDDWHKKVSSGIDKTERFGDTQNEITDKKVDAPEGPTIKPTFLSKLVVGTVVCSALVFAAYKSSILSSRL